VATAGVVDALVNPNNSSQRYVLWGNGRIDAIGGAPTVTGQATWYDRVDQPIAVAIWITNWATGAGYVLDKFGGVHDHNGATAMTNGLLNGVPYTNGTATRYVDWSWDPSGSGQGYALDHYGQLWPFGGATAPTVVSGKRWVWAAAKKLAMQWSPTKKAIILDVYGGLSREFGLSTAPTPGLYSYGNDVARDLAVTDWTTPAGYELDKYGAVHEWGGAPAITGPYRAGADVAREIEVLSASNPTRLWEVWSGAQQWEPVASTPPTVTAGGGSSEVQTITKNGTVTGGTFTLTYSGQTTAAIAYNATASAVQTALRALSNIGSTGVSVTGTGAPATPWAVTFAGSLANTDVPQMTATSSLTGTSPSISIAIATPGEASSPTATVTTTTRPVLAWNYTDPQGDTQTAWELYVYTQAFVNTYTVTAEDGSVINNPLTYYGPQVGAASAVFAASGIEPTTRGATPTVDLANGTYRMYVRAQDSAGQWSAWSNYGWTQNVPLPATPTGLTATANQAGFSVALSVSATTGGSANRVRFEYSDNGGTTWAGVRGATAVLLKATTTATDPDAPLGIARQYRAIAYATSPRVASAASNTATATLTTLAYVLTAVDSAALGGKMRVQEPVEWVRPVSVGVFQGLGADYATVIKDGRPKGKRFTVHLFSEDATTFATIQSLAESVSTLVYRDPYGSVRYCELVGDWPASLIEGAGTRHIHDTSLDLVEVKPPQEV